MLTGLAVASNVLAPAIIGDMFESDRRGSAMSLIMLAPLIGGAIGPAIAGAIAQTLGWREVLWIAAGLAVVCEVLFLSCCRETYKMAILRRRVKKIQRESGEFESVKTKSGRAIVVKLWHSVTRPFAVLFGSSVLMLMSLFGSVAFSYFYVMSVTLPRILTEVYGFTPAQTGAAFMSFSKWHTTLFNVNIANNTCRRRIVYERPGLQLRPRQDIHQTPRLGQRQRKARVPPPALHIRRLRAPAFRHSVRLGHGTTASHTAVARMRSTPRLQSATDDDTAIRIRR